ncbi:three-Cys-motif partner protein TcmP [Porticoccus sp.]
MKQHRFGGIWTRKKLDVLDQYLRFYVTALKQQPFTLHYADAFAGTGKHAPVDDAGQELLVPCEDFKGSVLTALEVEPGFDRFHFNDLDPGHVRELEKIRVEHADKDIRIYQRDANQFVPEFCTGLGRGDRAVLLLDPYSTQLDWSTLGAVAESGKVDLWLLFPLSVILRMTPTEGTRVRPDWEDTLNRLLGTDEWMEELYKPMVTPPMDDLFGDTDPTPLTRRLNTDELERWVTERLRTLFPYVAEPVRLNNNGRPLFSFYFAVSNKRPAAWGLAAKAATHITRKIDSNH